MKIIFALSLLSAAVMTAAPAIGFDAALATIAVMGIFAFAIADYSRDHQPLLVDLSDSATRKLRSPLRLAV